MKIAANIIGVIGVVLYISSYQFKRRKTIVAMYTVANLMYVDYRQKERQAVYSKISYIYNARA